MAGKTGDGKAAEPVRHAPKKMKEEQLYFLPSDQVRGLFVPALVKKVNVKGLRKVHITVEEYMPEIMQRMERTKNRNWEFSPRTYDITKKKLKQKSYLRIDNKTVSFTSLNLESHP